MQSVHCHGWPITGENSQCKYIPQKLIESRLNCIHCRICRDNSNTQPVPLLANPASQHPTSSFWTVWNSAPLDTISNHLEKSIMHSYMDPHSKKTQYFETLDQVLPKNHLSSSEKQHSHPVTPTEPLPSFKWFEWNLGQPALNIHAASMLAQSSQDPASDFFCTRVIRLSWTRTCYIACIVCLYLLLHDDMYPNPSFSSLPQQFASQPHLHPSFLQTRIHNQTVFEIEEHLPNFWPLEQIEQILSQ